MSTTNNLYTTEETHKHTDGQKAGYDAHVDKEHIKHKGEHLKNKAEADRINTHDHQKPKHDAHVEKEHLKHKHDANKLHDEGKHRVDDRTVHSTQTPKLSVNAEQEGHRMNEAQELLRELQEILKGDSPAMDALSSLLQRTEQLSSQVAGHPNMDPATRKTLEDISALLEATRKEGRNKGIADRLQRISDETAKAVEANKRSDVPQATRENTQRMLNYIQEWRPVFFLLMRSAEFRQLIVDSLRIARRLVYNYGDDMEGPKQKFKEGAGLKEMYEHTKETTQQMETPEMSEEEYNLLQEDIQRVLITMAREPSYRDGINKIFNLLDSFQKYLVEKDVTSNVKPDEKHARNAVNETEELVASFSGRESLNRFKKHLKNLTREIQKNQNLHSYLHELKQFILSAKSEEEIRSQDFNRKIRVLSDRGRELKREFKDHDDLELFLQAADDMFQNFKNDEFLQILQHHAGIIRSDLSYVDSEGQSHVDTDMLSKLRGVLISVVADQLKYIPIPRIENSDKKQDFVIDNLVLCTYDIIPEKIRFHLESDSELNVKDVAVDTSLTHLVISLDIKTELKDVEFYFHKKTFPKFEEKGRVTFRFMGDGARLTITYAVEQGPTDKIPKMKRGYANFDISQMAIDFDKDTLKHPHLVPGLTNMFKSVIKQRIEKAIESNLTGLVEKLGEKMTASLSEVNKPLFSGLSGARNAVKSSQIAQVHQKRKDKLE